MQLKGQIHSASDLFTEILRNISDIMLPILSDKKIKVRESFLNLIVSYADKTHGETARDGQNIWEFAKKLFLMFIKGDYNGDSRLV